MGSIAPEVTRLARWEVKIPTLIANDAIRVGHPLQRWGPFNVAMEVAPCALEFGGKVGRGPRTNSGMRMKGEMYGRTADENYDYSAWGEAAVESEG